MLTNKEYKQRREAHLSAEDVSPCVNYNPYTGYCNAYLEADAVKELKQDIKSRKAAGAVVLPGSNNKATYRETETGSIILTSYYTDVAAIYGGMCVKLWNGYTVTTLNHVNEFLSVHGMHTITKREWIEANINYAISHKINKGV